MKSNSRGRFLLSSPPRDVPGAEARPGLGTNRTQTLQVTLQELDRK